jgi:hypothetical protein
MNDAFWTATRRWTKHCFHDTLHGSHNLVPAWQVNSFKSLTRLTYRLCAEHRDANVVGIERVFDVVGDGKHDCSRAAVRRHSPSRNCYNRNATQCPFSLLSLYAFVLAAAVAPFSAQRTYIEFRRTLDTEYVFVAARKYFSSLKRIRVATRYSFVSFSRPDAFFRECFKAHCTFFRVRRRRVIASHSLPSARMVLHAVSFS